MDEIITILYKIKDSGHKEIKLEYSGGGDSGDIDSVAFDNINVDVIFSDEVEKIKDWVHSTILNQIGDWYNNDGGRGVITIDLTEMTYHVDEVYYTMSEETNCSDGELTNLID